MARKFDATKGPRAASAASSATYVGERWHPALMSRAHLAERSIGGSMMDSKSMPVETGPAWWQTHSCSECYMRLQLPHSSHGNESGHFLRRSLFSHVGRGEFLRCPSPGEQVPILVDRDQYRTDDCAHLAVPARLSMDGLFPRRALSMPSVARPPRPG